MSYNEYLWEIFNTDDTQTQSAYNNMNQNLKKKYMIKERENGFRRHNMSKTRDDLQIARLEGALPLCGKVPRGP